VGENQGLNESIGRGIQCDADESFIYRTIYLIEDATRFAGSEPSGLSRDELIDYIIQCSFALRFNLFPGLILNRMRNVDGAEVGAA
jgi:hypothetical protein